MRGELAEKVVEVVLRDLSGRRGFCYWWDDIDPDIQREIRETLIEKVRGALA